jgi:hypothetical protein
MRHDYAVDKAGANWIKQAPKHPRHPIHDDPEYFPPETPVAASRTPTALREPESTQGHPVSSKNRRWQWGIAWRNADRRSAIPLLGAW